MIFDLEDWVSRYLPDLRVNSTGQAVGACPFCEKSDRFYLAVTGGKIGHYICHKCGERGRTPVYLIAHVEGITKREAMQRLMKAADMFRRREGTPADLLTALRTARGLDPVEDDPVDFELPPQFIPIFDAKRKKKWKFPVYLKERGVKRETAKAWGLGFTRTGRYAGRLIIPVECPNGRSWTGRDMTGEQEPKYINPFGADHSRLLLGWDHTRLGEDICLVEGPLDAIKAWQAGVPALALMGKSISNEQAALLHTKPADAAITIMLDPEEAVAPYDVAAQLITHFNNVHIAKLPDGEDPGSTTPEVLLHAYKKADKYRGRTTSKLTAMLSASRKKLEEFYQ